MAEKIKDVRDGLSDWATHRNAKEKLLTPTPQEPVSTYTNHKQFLTADKPKKRDHSFSTLA